MPEPSQVPAERIERCILMIRGEKVMLDADLAQLYGVETRSLLQAVKRNADRFPPDFAFQPTPEEFDNLRSQTVISSWGGRRYPPYAFTEHGIAMLSSVLRSPRAVQVNIEIMRAFIRLRRMLASHRDLARKLEEEVRCPVQDRLRRHPSAHGPAGEAPAVHRLPGRGGEAGVREAPSVREIESMNAVGTDQGRGRYQPGTAAVVGV